MYRASCSTRDSISRLLHTVGAAIQATTGGRFDWEFIATGGRSSDLPSVFISKFVRENPRQAPIRVSIVNNWAGPSAAAAIAAMIGAMEQHPGATGPTQYSLGKNRFGGEGIRAICAALSRSKLVCKCSGIPIPPSVQDLMQANRRRQMRKRCIRLFRAGAVARAMVRPAAAVLGSRVGSAASNAAAEQSHEAAPAPCSSASASASGRGATEITASSSPQGTTQSGSHRAKKRRRIG